MQFMRQEITKFCFDWVFMLLQGAWDVVTQGRVGWVGGWGGEEVEECVVQCAGAGCQVGVRVSLDAGASKLRTGLVDRVRLSETFHAWSRSTCANHGVCALVDVHGRV